MSDKIKDLYQNIIEAEKVEIGRIIENSSLSTPEKVNQIIDLKRSIIENQEMINDQKFKEF